MVSYHPFPTISLTHLFLTEVFSQDRNDARMFMKYLHPDLGVGKDFSYKILTIVSASNCVLACLSVELPERSYGADCRIYVPENPRNSFINVYVCNLHLSTLLIANL